MEVFAAVRLGYYEALDGALSIPVYQEGSIPENTPRNYVIITAFTGDQRFTDKCKVFEVTQMLDIVTDSQNPTGYGYALTIANEIENIINPDSGANIDITDHGYRIGNTFAIQTQPQFQKDNTRYIYRVIKRYRHLISKL